jgi:hypothetical protein
VNNKDGRNSDNGACVLRLFPHTWVPKAALPQLEEHVASLKKVPPVPTGAPDPYEPPMPGKL